MGEIKPEQEKAGREYEELVGQLYDLNGWQVDARGLKLGVKDLGIDIVCTRGIVRHVVQCKCWTNTVDVHTVEDFAKAVHSWRNRLGEHSAQATMFDTPPFQISAVFVSNSAFTPEACAKAKALGVIVKDRRTSAKLRLLVKERSGEIGQPEVRYSRSSPQVGETWEYEIARPLPERGNSGCLGLVVCLALAGGTLIHFVLSCP